MLENLNKLLVAAALLGLSTTASALPINSMPGNDTLATAQDLDAFFDLSFNAQIENSAMINTSTVLPHAEISGLGDGTFDWFTFTVGEDNSIAIFDIDCGRQYLGFQNTGCSDRADSFDPVLDLFDGGGTMIASADDNFAGDSGSENTGLDSFVELSLDAGDYSVRVSQFGGNVIADGSEYILNVSVQHVPTPSVLALSGIGLLTLGLSRRRA